VWRPQAEFTADHVLNLSAYLIRLGRHNDAIDLLTNVIDRHPDNFLLQANLGTASWQAGQDQRAIFYLKRALDRWPARLNDLDPEQRKYFAAVFSKERSFEDARKAQDHYFKLLKLRLKQRQGGAPTSDIVHLLLSPDGKPVRFVGEDGRFTPGKMAADEKRKLPFDAIEIVQQLLIWSPQSPELYWLLGELYNARGDVKAADELFRTAVDTGERSPEFLEHRRILQSHLNQAKGEGQGADPDGKKDGKTEDAGWSPSPWYMFALGFVAGAVVLLLAGSQLWLLARRLRGRRARSRVPVHPGGATRHEGGASATTFTADKPVGGPHPTHTDANHDS
jgi:tetratricopeptide (TPR) repeat protein